MPRTLRAVTIVCCLFTLLCDVSAQQGKQPAPKTTGQPTSPAGPQASTRKDEDPLYGSLPFSALLKQLESGDLEKMMQAAHSINWGLSERLKQGKQLTPIEKSAIPVLGKMVRAITGIEELWQACMSALLVFGEDAIPEYVEMLKYKPQSFQDVPVNLMGAEGIINTMFMRRIESPRPETIEAAKEAAQSLAVKLTEGWIPKMKATYKIALKATGRFNLPAVISGVKHKDPFVRKDFIEVLGAMGSDAKEAIPALTEATKDTDPEVGKAALNAIAQIENKPNEK